MTRADWFRALVFLLILTVASPSMLAAGDSDHPKVDRQSGLASALWGAFVWLVPVLEGVEIIASPEKPTGESNPDLGPGLDPAGTPGG